MKKFITTALTALALSTVAIPATAQASPVNECGSGYYAFNITTRNVTCHDARHFVSMLEERYPVGNGLPRSSGWVRLPGWHAYWATVKARYLGYDSLGVYYQFDVRSTRTNHVIRFQFSYIYYNNTSEY